MFVKTKIILYNTVIKPECLYAAESFTFSKERRNKGIRKDRKSSEKDSSIRSNKDFLSKMKNYQTRLEREE